MSQPIDWSMAAMLRDSVVVVVVIVRTRPRAIPLAMIAMRKILHGFPFLSRDAYGAPLGGPSGRRSSAKKNPGSAPGVVVPQRFFLHLVGYQQARPYALIDCQPVMHSYLTPVIEWFPFRMTFYPPKC